MTRCAREERGERRKEKSEGRRAKSEKQNVIGWSEPAEMPDGASTNREDLRRAQLCKS
jgi:hypothetical protein